MRVFFRTDSSTDIGSGHVIRCLALAEELRQCGAEIIFICREYMGNLCGFIESKGFSVSLLSGNLQAKSACEDWETDARESAEAIGKCDWLIMDHYGLDKQWERHLRKHTRHIMVIDDLANREHDADILLDQNFNSPLHKNYKSLLPDGCIFLLGSKYSLIRAEFRLYRDEALSRRDGSLKRLLVFMGGGDPDNDTVKVLSGLLSSSIRSISVDVVLGGSNPYYEKIKQFCKQLPFATLHVQTPRMAELMTLSDCAINASGSTTWERCTLGLPALVVIQSNDQVAVANAVHQRGGHRLLGWANKLTSKDYADALDSLDPDDLLQMSEISAGLCDGRGAIRVAEYLLKF